jgi:hypothetical protein
MRRNRWLTENGCMDLLKRQKKGIPKNMQDATHIYTLKVGRWPVATSGVGVSPTELTASTKKGVYVGRKLEPATVEPCTVCAPDEDVPDNAHVFAPDVAELFAKLRELDAKGLLLPLDHPADCFCAECRDECEPAWSRKPVCRETSTPAGVRFA